MENSEHVWNLYICLIITVTIKPEFYILLLLVRPKNRINLTIAEHIFLRPLQTNVIKGI